MQSSDMFWKSIATLSFACALTVTGLVVRRELRGPSTSPRRIASMPPIAVEGWGSLFSGGQLIGAKDATVRIVEFADFECPACRRFHQTTLAFVRKTYPEKVAVAFRHFPLDYHRFAMPAARAAECAADQGRFEEYHDLLYSKQDSLGLKSFVEIASEAGIPDLITFETCAKGVSKDTKIKADLALAVALKAAGTPTILVDGLMYSSVPDSAKLDSLIRASGT